MAAAWPMSPATPSFASISSHSLTVSALIFCRLNGLEECWIDRSPCFENGVEPPYKTVPPARYTPMTRP